MDDTLKAEAKKMVLKHLQDAMAELEKKSLSDRFAPKEEAPAEDPAMEEASEPLSEEEAELIGGEVDAEDPDKAEDEKDAAKLKALAAMKK